MPFPSCDKYKRSTKQRRSCTIDASVDLEKAFDRVPREVVRWALMKLGVDEWPIRTVMALYTEACTVVRTDAGLSESFEVKVGLHQGSVLSPLFAAVMDVVSSDARSGRPSELLYADDLVLMAPTMEQFGSRVAEWRASLLDKGLKVNAGKSSDGWEQWWKDVCKLWKVALSCLLERSTNKLCSMHSM